MFAMSDFRLSLRRNYPVWFHDNCDGVSLLRVVVVVVLTERRRGHLQHSKDEGQSSHENSLQVCKHIISFYRTKNGQTLFKGIWCFELQLFVSSN